MNKSSLLLAIPPELCNELCGYLDPTSITNLLKTNHALAHKLRNRGGLRDIRLVFPPHSQLLPWPRRYLSTFVNLRSLYYALPSHSKTTYRRLTLTTEDAAALPRGLEHLVLVCQLTISVEVFDALPRGLVSLSLPSCTSPGSDCIPKLPRSLTRLELPKAHRITDEHLESLPASITVLNLASAAISGAGLEKLPHSITSLNLEKNEVLTAGDIGKIPPLVTQLRLIRPIVNANDDELALLPESLRSLNLVFNVNFTDKGLSRLPAKLQHLASAWNPQISSRGFGLLPRSLLSLTVSWPEVIDSSFELLPVGLVSLRLDSMTVTDECLKFLPASLTALVLNQTVSISDAGLRYIKAPLRHLAIPDARITPDAAMVLPQTLTDIEFKSLSFYEPLEMLHVEYMPRNLTSLVIDKNRNMTVDVFARLPRSVHTFSAALLLLTDVPRLAELPPYIKYLRLRGSPAIKENLWKYVPKSIQHLYLEGCTFDVRHVPLFSRNLRTLTLTVNKPSQHPGPQRSEVSPEVWGPHIPPQLDFVRSRFHNFRKLGPGQWEALSTSFN